LSAFSEDAEVTSDEMDRYIRKPQVYFTKEGDKEVFQAGEDVKILKMPPGTRVIYGGVRCNGTQGRANWERMINDALENSANDDPLRLKLQKLKEKVSTWCK